LELIERAESLVNGSPLERAQTVVWFHGTAGVSDSDLVREAGVGTADTAEIVAELQRTGTVAELSLGPQRILRLHADVMRELEERALSLVGQLHSEFPLLTMHDRKMVQARLEYAGDEALVHAVIDRLLARGALVGDARRIARADFKPKLSANQRKLMDRIVAAHRDAQFQPPEPGSFANQAGGHAGSLRDIFEVAVAEGSLVRAAEDLYLHADWARELQERVRNKLRERDGGLTVAEIRDLLGTTRKYAVPLCEYLDQAGVTRRSGDLRVLAAESAKSDDATGE
jgi:selenocysteine-specific elongation factor